jgi:hypothetical protein
MHAIALLASAVAVVVGMAAAPGCPCGIVLPALTGPVSLPDLPVEYRPRQPGMAAHFKPMPARGRGRGRGRGRWGGRGGGGGAYGNGADASYASNPAAAAFAAAAVAAASGSLAGQPGGAGLATAGSISGAGPVDGQQALLDHQHQLVSSPAPFPLLLRIRTFLHMLCTTGAAHSRCLPTCSDWLELLLWGCRSCGSAWQRPLPSPSLTATTSSAQSATG